MFRSGFCGGVELLSWKRRFDDAIVLPDGRKLVTLLGAVADSNSERNLAGWEPPSILLMNR
jgi:hypothetical protein